jgi:sulfate permease, SulP family
MARRSGACRRRSQIRSALVRASRSRPPIALLAQASGTDGPFVDTKRHPEAAEVPGVAILRVESALFFANADAVRDHIRAHAADEHVKAIVIDAETVPPST